MKDDLKRLKILWDYCAMLNNTYKDWFRTLWDNIDTVKLQDENRNLTNMIKNIPQKDKIK